MTRTAAQPDAPIIAPGHTLASVTHVVAAVPLLRRTPPLWLAAFGLASGLFLLLLLGVTWLCVAGVGIWGINIPVGWGFAIVNFVWWIGIGHAGTLISAILLLLRQDWRTSINRFAEAMTLFAVSCAGLFPLLHLGRIWKFYYILPYPDTLGLWPQWRSPLVWDVFAVSTYFTISLVFWYVGLVPDLATLRDRAGNPVARFLYGVFSLGWRNSTRHWHRYRMAYLLLAGLATPLVVSVHSVVSLDFASALLPGWHTTIFPPYFVAGAIYSGFAMVFTLVIPVRAVVPGFRGLITERHFNAAAKIMLATGWVVIYGYAQELFASWYSDNQYEMYMSWNRMTGPYGYMYWLLIFCNCVAVQVLWSRRARVNTWVLFVVSILINVGMWVERYVIIITSLHRDFLPSSWGMYAGTRWDYCLLLGSFGLFLAGMLLFLRFVPAIAMFEMRELVAHENTPHVGAAAEGGAA